MTSATRTWTFLTSLMILIVIIGQSLAGREGLLWGVALALTINSLIFLYPDLRLKLFFSGKVLEGKDPWGINEMVHTLVQRARIPMPQIKILQNSAPQALALGRSPRSAQILLTQGLIDLFEPEELNAILAYQVATIKRQDIVGLTVAAAFLDFALSICQLLDSGLRIILGAKKKQNSLQAHFFSTLISPLVSLFLRLEIGGSSYFKSDQLAAELNSNP
ncbi:MAG: M48 family metalloprotease, partial [Bdellovibrionales bacterium]|nr:M48 family metalloprotease [Bdellovibrionales bacterium]